MSIMNQFLISFFLLFHSADAFNITQLLSQYNQFSTFNHYLIQTQVAEAINYRQNITVLAVDNGNISPLSGKPADVLKSIMSVHVILDYYDVQKLQHLPNRTVILKTLLQASEVASGQQGFLNATDTGTGSVVIGSALTSAAKGSTLGASLVKSIAAQPYNVSVLQISNVIIPLGVENSPSPSPSPWSAPARAPAPAPARAPAPSPRQSLTPAPSPAPLMPPSMSPGLAPSLTPLIPPFMSPPKPGPAPAADAPAADAPPADTPRGAGVILRLSHGDSLMVVLSVLWLVATI